MRKFSSPPDPKEFKMKVWNAVMNIPAGRVATYGQIAELIASPAEKKSRRYKAFGARWVGGAMVGCPPGVPWQRVVNSRGTSSLKNKSKEAQISMLMSEGVIFDTHGKIDLKVFQWSGS